MKDECPHHDANYFTLKREKKAEKGLQQRQCPTCLRWYFHGEYGKGWKQGIKLEETNL